MTELTQAWPAPLRFVADGFIETFARWSPPPRPVAPGREWGRFDVIRRLLSAPLVPWVMGLIVLALSAASAQSDSGTSLGLLIGIVTAVPVVVASRNALVGWRLAALVTLVLAPFDIDQNGLWAFPVLTGVVLIVLTGAVAIAYDRGIALWAMATTTAVMTIWVVGNRLIWIVGFGALAIVTDIIRSRRLTAQALIEEQELTGLERARRVAFEERTRIARELHDVVAHHMSIVAVRAETAPYRVTGLSEEVREEFAEIAEAARTSLNEIRSLLGVLRSDEAMRVPQPGLDQLEEMVEATRRAGVEVDLNVTGDRRPVRPAVELTAYRILQESLSNVARHAPGAPAEVWIDYGTDSLGVIVANPWADRDGETGHGIMGMTERAVAVGGTLEARRRPDGRFVVEAVLPVEP
ncbi:MAG TPA: histidine kinase [Acidimicrobiia bacterium]|nr:histidine kinase [Acidimicrobiia bacterium]